MKSEREILGTELLASVSRSFYITLRLLPPAVREPLSVAYLLARATDTVADAARVPVPARLENLDGLRQMIEGEKNASQLEMLKQIPVAHPGEKILLERFEECLDWFSLLDDKEEIRDVLKKIIHGQRLDLERFGDSPSSLKSDGELDEYTYLVAGCVGEFWTRICFKRLPEYAIKSEAEMVSLGVQFGKGLQLVNILRDLPADLNTGRCYLPVNNRDELPMAFAKWMKQAKSHLDAATDYLSALRPWRLRYACFFPWYLGLKTLCLLQHQSPLETDLRIKVSRNEVRKAFAWGMLAAVSRRALRFIAKRIV